MGENNRPEGPIDPLVLEAIMAGVPPIMAAEAVASRRLDSESTMLDLARDMSAKDKGATA